MAEFQRIEVNGILVAFRRLDTGASVPLMSGNRDYDELAARIAGGYAPLAADPAPIVYGRTVPIVERRAVTVNTTPAELLRATIPALTMYRARLTLTAIADNLAARLVEAIVVVARGVSGALIVQNAGAQNQTVVADHRSNATAGSWAVMPSIEGNDYVLTVTGSAGRTVQWRLVGTVESFTPGGES